MKKKIIGFGQLRNESENGNLENWFRCMEPCEHIYIFDQASTDNSKEIYEKYKDKTTVIYSPTNRFEEELICKSELYKLLLKEHPDVDWVLWLDGDLLLDGRLLIDDNLQKLCNKLDDAGVDLPRFGHYNLWRSDKWYRKDNSYHNLHGHWFPLWGKPTRLWFDERPGLHHGQVPQGTQSAALVDVNVIHFGFKNEKKIVGKYLHYKSLGQSGWDLDRLIDEETLDVDEVPSEIYPEWFNIEDTEKPTEKEPLLSLYKNKLNE
jgi:glycosyltransferase involved in cell wall biosynthesis